MFKTSLFLSPQVLAIVIRSHIFHMHLVTLLLKDKTTHYFSPGSRSAITTTIYCKNITNNGEVMKYHMVSYVWRITLTPLSVQLLLRPNSHSSVFMKSSSTSVMLLSQYHPNPQLCSYLNSSFFQQSMGINTSSLTLSGVPMSYTRL